MDYLSDDDKEEETQQLTFEEEYPEEEMDEETYNIIFGAKALDDIDLEKGLEIKPKKEKKEKKVKPVKEITTLEELIKKTEPKKWKSKRIENKKSTEEPKEKIIKRQFNPRPGFPPYKTIDRSKLHEQQNPKMNIKDESSFPTLK